MKTNASPPSKEERWALRRQWALFDYLGDDQVWVETEAGLLLRPGFALAAPFPAKRVPELGTLLFGKETQGSSGVELVWSDEGAPATARVQVVPVRELALRVGDRIALSSAPEVPPPNPLTWAVARVLGTLRSGPPGSLERWLHLFYTTTLRTDYAPLTAWEGRWPVFATQP